ncbi:MAG: hypothetical protein PHV05_01665 [Candidatus Riflebacteria bacterium]|nr:hypothetical protein [Candidatus Riflebacteria bacterium]
MDVLELMRLLRNLFATYKVPEIPCFPAELKNSWCHPDILLTILGRPLKHCFTFQQMTKRDVFPAEPALKAPSLVWLVDKSGREFSALVTGFLADLQKLLQPERSEPAFSIVADSRHKMSAGEQGAHWKILFDGVECGTLSLYAKIFGQTVPAAGSAILTLQLCRLVSSLNPDQFSMPAGWSAAGNLSDFLSLSAWQCSKSDLDADSINELIATSDSLTASEAFCFLIAVYNNNKSFIDKSPVLMPKLSERLSSISSKLLAGEK